MTVGCAALGRPAKFTATNLDVFAQEEMVAQTVEYQVSHGATAIIPPYVHLDRLDDGWIDVQAGLWYRTRRYLDRENIALPTTAVLALGWRALHPVHGPAALAPVLAALSVLAPSEVALAASKADQGVRTHDRVMDLILMIERLRRDYPVIAWQQGHLGEISVAAGAVGYECGIGWRESWDLGTRPTRIETPHRRGEIRPSGLHPQVGAQHPEALRGGHPRTSSLWMRMICLDTECCPPGGAVLLGDARAHPIVQRVRNLDEIARIDRPVSRWQHLAGIADDGLDLAHRINRRAQTAPEISQVNIHALAAISAVSHTRRVDVRSRRVA